MSLPLFRRLLLRLPRQFRPESSTRGRLPAQHRRGRKFCKSCGGRRSRVCMWGGSRWQVAATVLDIEAVGRYFGKEGRSRKQLEKGRNSRRARKRQNVRTVTEFVWCWEERPRKGPVVSTADTECGYTEDKKTSTLRSVLIQRPTIRSFEYDLGHDLRKSLRNKPNGTEAKTTSIEASDASWSDMWKTPLKSA